MNSLKGSVYRTWQLSVQQYRGEELEVGFQFSIPVSDNLRLVQLVTALGPAGHIHSSWVSLPVISPCPHPNPELPRLKLEP